MKKLVIICLLISMLAAAAGTYAMYNCPHESIADMDCDLSANLYSLTNYWFGTILGKTNTDNETEKCRLLSGSKNGADIKYKNITVDEKNLYVLYEYYVDNFHKIVIDEYDFDLKFIKTIYTKSIETENEIITELSYNLLNNTIGLATVVDNSVINIINMDTISFTAEEKDYILNDKIEILKIALSGYGALLIDSEHHIYNIADNGSIVKINAEMTAFSIGSIFITPAYFDIHTSSINEISATLIEDKSFKINADTPNIETICGADDYISEGIRMYDIDNVYFFSNISYGGIKADETTGHDTVYSFGLEAGKKYTLFAFTIVQYVLIAAAIMAAAFLILFLIGIIVRMLLSRRKLVTKQLLIIVFVMLVSIYPSYTLINSVCSGFINEAVVLLLQKSVISIDNVVNPETFGEEGLSEEEICDIDRIAELSSGYKSTLAENTVFSLVVDEGNLLNRMYYEVAYEENGKYYYSYSDNLNANVKYFSAPGVLKNIEDMGEGDLVIAHESVENTEWLSVTLPIINSEGEKVGFIQVGTESIGLNKAVDLFSILILIVMEFIILVIVLIFIATLTKLLKPLRIIKVAVNELAAGKIDEIKVIKSNDELQDISHSFNSMTIKLNQYFDSINTVSQTYEKYVPKDFFKLLGKESILDVSVNDRIELDMNFMYIQMSHNIANRTEEENYIRLGKIHEIVSECITVHNGGIYGYDDSRIMCVFTEGLERVLETAIVINERISGSYNDISGISISVQSAHSYFGVIGSHNSMKCVVVSVAMTIQNFLDRIASAFSLKLILTEQVYSIFKNAKNYTIRKIGTIGDLLSLISEEETYRGVVLYEVIDCETIEQKKLKEITLNDFQNGFELYEQGNYVAARGYFINVLRLNRGDAVARNYLDHIEENLNGRE